MFGSRKIASSKVNMPFSQLFKKKNKKNEKASEISFFFFENIQVDGRPIASIVCRREQRWQSRENGRGRKSLTKHPSPGSPNPGFRYRVQCFQAHSQQHLEAICACTKQNAKSKKKSTKSREKKGREDGGSFSKTKGQISRTPLQTFYL